MNIITLPPVDINMHFQAVFLGFFSPKIRNLISSFQKNTSLI
uniref:Uncharacterized protein n=1 Tax=uncultured bacterium A1Q1_fos_504 TaxID=1256580 RepID=L7VXC2_9BACT|nr:hypothetical protein [uncultured bacterium A1Q1_fos_504]